MDPHFMVETLAATPYPQTLIWQAMHQDYSERWVADECPPEEEDEAGRLVVKHLLAGDRGHYGPLEHPSITVACGFFPHSVVQQARTHRIGVTFDVQSGRYTGTRICQAARGEIDIEEVVYLRPVGVYSDRNGTSYSYLQTDRDFHLRKIREAAEQYRIEVEEKGVSEEHARGTFPFDIRQHFVVTFNLRSLLHFLDLRAKADAQLEIRWLCDLIWPHVRDWTPQVAEWYETRRLGKARLAP